MDLLKWSLRFDQPELLAYRSKQIPWANDGAKDERCLTAFVKIVQQRVNQRRFSCAHFAGKDYKTLPGSDSIGKLCQPLPMARAEVKEARIWCDIKRSLAEPRNTFDIIVDSLVPIFPKSTWEKIEHKRFQPGFRSKPPQGSPWARRCSTTLPRVTRAGSVASNGTFA
jgi:hypothetical protein